MQLLQDIKGKIDRLCRVAVLSVGGIAKGPATFIMSKSAEAPYVRPEFTLSASLSIDVNRPPKTVFTSSSAIRSGFVLSTPTFPIKKKRLRRIRFVD
jgi:hypothetical protein